MCGSGTILIEAALIARHMAPGINREFAAQHWPSLDAAAWDDARPDKLRKLFNGTIEVNHYQYHATPDRSSAPLAPAA